jgi:putative membrane protein
MKKFLIRWLITAVSIFVVAHMVRGIEVPSVPVVLVVALVLGIINAFVRPQILLITLPINILTLGLFTQNKGNNRAQAGQGSFLAGT